MKRFHLASIILVASGLTGCSHPQFDRFMDHPILSWAPFTQADIDKLNPLAKATPATVGRYSNKACRTQAEQRTEYLDLDQYGEDDIANIFSRNYYTCVADEKKYGH
jgi:hypothetical protein